MLFMFACFVAYLCILVIVLVFICMISCVCMRAGQSAGVEEHMLVSRRPHHCGLILLLALGTTLDNDDCHYSDDYFGDGGDALREEVNLKKNVFFWALPEGGGGGLPMPEFFGPLFISAFLVNKKSLFLQKCQCIELLTVFRLHIYSISYSIYSIFSSKLTFKS